MHLEVKKHLFDIRQACERIISFRNILAHGYDSISNELVWSIIGTSLPALLTYVNALLDD